MFYMSDAFIKWWFTLFIHCCHVQRTVPRSFCHKNQQGIRNIVSMEKKCISFNYSDCKAIKHKGTLLQQLVLIPW